MNKKVLIFFPHLLKRRHGGPYSMLYHLKEGLRNAGSNVYFLSDQMDFPGEDKAGFPSYFSKIKRFLLRLLSKRMIANYRVKKWIMEVSVPLPVPFTTDALNEYAVLHFHETIDVWRFRRLLEGYNGHIVLTSHTPKPYHLELLEDVMNLTKNAISATVYNRLEAIDLYAYQKAGELIFPCQEATLPYIECWPVFKKIMAAKTIGVVVTGVLPSVPVKENIGIRQQLHIPEDAFVVTFVGRQLPVKGYDLLVTAATALLPGHPGLYFIIVGKKSEFPLQHPRWIETGWTDDPFSYVAAGDLHVVPNRFTNFDLNVLEVLSLGKPVLLSNTGGNNYFKRFSSPAIFYHEPTVDSLVKELENCFADKQHLKGAGGANKEIYAAHFTAERFAKDQLNYYAALS